VAVVGPGGAILARAATHARRPMDPRRLASAGEGSWAASAAGESYLVRVHADGDRRVIVAESTRAVRERLRASLRRLAAWYGGLGLLLLGVINVVMRRAVLRPVRRLSRAAHQLGQGRLGIQVDVATDDELGALGRRFNAMSRALAEHAAASRRELEAARRVQEHLLPPPVVRLGGVEVAGRCLSAGPVGGDLYDVRALPGGRVGLLVADLSGHNVAAALHTAMVRAIAWREAEQASTPGEALARMNERLCRDLPEEHFATAFLGWFDPHAGRLRYANAGHPNAYLRDAAGQVAELDVTGPILGVLPDAAYEDRQIDIEPDSLLLAYTDGITEACDRAGSLWGTGEMVALLASAELPDPEEMVGRLLERLAAFREGDARQDDATIVVARYRPEAGADGQTAAQRTRQTQFSDSAEEAGDPVHARPASAPAPWAG
jgi:serine phosphatase RsbU (regulator of sigma subunit)